jgi:2-succinyl-5-enolpyruvyl-6-hydroxy-3-cyclohexene-1-carboxylate synthase
LQEHVYIISKVCSDSGIDHAVISPGSRSAPLVFAFTRNRKITCHSVVDERSAAFIALGIAQQTGKPVVLICTSGTAALNYFPAIAEAYYQKIPLLILTADRPPELLNQQDGQMIMQKGVYGKHVLASHELPCFEEGRDDPELTERIVMNALVQCMQPVQQGPVHINVPLREPLYPTDKKNVFPRTHMRVKDSDFTRLSVKEADVEAVKQAWNKSARKLIIIGQHPPSRNLRHALNVFTNHDDVGIIADVVSNQHEVSPSPLHDFICTNADDGTMTALEPDLVISLGGPLVSKPLKTWLKQKKPRYHFRLQPAKEKVDTYNNVTSLIRCMPEQFLDSFINAARLKPKEKVYAAAWRQANERAATAIRKFTAAKTWSELHAVRILLDQVPEGTQMQVANSTPIRYLSLLGVPARKLEVFANRGTSGIDGCSSTAVGAALVNEKITTLITGDLAFFYDRNAFWNYVVPPNLRIIMLNNHGGGIFNLINGPSMHPEVDYFTTSHHLDASAFAEQHNIEYYSRNSADDLSKIMKMFFKPSRRARMLELSFSPRESAEAFVAFRNLRM